MPSPRRVIRYPGGVKFFEKRSATSSALRSCTMRNSRNARLLILRSASSRFFWSTPGNWITMRLFFLG